MRSGARLIAFLGLLAMAAGCGRSYPDRLVVAHPRPLDSLRAIDPGHNRVSFNILINVYEPLVERGEGFTLRPALAASWSSPDPLTWVFRLHDGVRRHDGGVLTAADVVASFDRARQDPWLAGALAPVDGVTARGRGEVVVHTREPSDLLLGRLVYVSVAGLPEPGGATGRYRVRSYSPTGNVVLEAFAEHREGPAPIRLVEFRIVKDPHERARQLMEGKVHLIEEISPEDMPALQAARGVRTAAVPGLSTAFLAMDTARPRTPYVDLPVNPFLDPRVREAVDLAVDRTALVAGPLRGFAAPIGQLAAPGQVGFDPAIAPPPADPGRARRLLAEAGFAGGFDVDLDYIEGTADQVVRALVPQLAAVGIRVRPRGSEPAGFLPRVERHDTSFYLLRWIQPSAEVHFDYSWLLHTPRDSLGSMNGGGYSSARLDDLLSLASHPSGEEERARLLRAATALVHADRPIVPLYRQSDLYAFDDRLDFEPEPYRQFSTVLARMRWRGQVPAQSGADGASRGSARTSP